MEEWKDVIGYEGLYQVSNLGKVKRLAYYNKVSGGGKQYRKEKLLVPVKHRNGYFFYGLCKDGVGKHIFAHRIVASSFIPNPQNYPQVNHKDEDKINNCVWNLEWCTAKYNSNYGTHILRSVETKKKSIKGKKQVIQYDTEGNELMRFISVREAGRHLNLDSSSISKCCKGKIKSYKNYFFCYE